MHEETDQVLLRACRRGDETAARALFARLAPVLMLYARSIVGDESRAEDAVQTAFSRIFSVSVRQIDRVESPRAWLAKIVRREAVTIIRADRRMARRHLRRHELTPHDNAMAHPPAIGVEDDAAPIDTQLLGSMVAALPRRLAELIVLKHVAALTFDQIAVSLGVNRNTAASRYRDAMQALRGMIAAEQRRGEQREEKSHVR